MIEILCMQLQKAYKHSLVHDAILLWRVSQKLYCWEKNENRCFAGGRTDTKLANTVEKRCVSPTSAVRDVSNDGNSRTHIVDLEEAFDKITSSIVMTMLVAFSVWWVL